MQPERRKQVVLGVALVVLAFTIYRAWPSTTIAVAPTPPASPRTPTSAATRGTTAGGTAPEVHLRALEEDRPKPVSAERNLFKFKPKPPPPPPPAPKIVAPPPPVVPAPPPGPPPVP